MRYFFTMLALLMATAAPALATSLGTSFSYQGNLNFNGSPASGNFDFQFALYTVASSGSAVDTTTLTDQSVAAGLINASLDFTEVPFDGQALWIEVRVRPAGSGTYTTLTPRQAISATPYALFALTGNQGPAGPQGAMGTTGAQVRLARKDPPVLQACKVRRDLQVLSPCRSSALVPIRARQSR